MFQLRLGLCVAMLASAMAKIGFIKDQSMDWQFPGPVFSQDKSLPDGHMRPLGWQRRPDGPVKEEEEMPASREFFLDFVEPKIPVVFRNGVREAPAFVTWEDDTYLSQQYGHLNVSVTVKVAKRRDKIQSAWQVMKLKKFLYDYMYDELYLASVIPEELMDELPLPKCVRCGSLAERLISSQLWMSSGGTSSRVHSHDHHLLHCVLFGRRDFIVINGAHKYAFDFVHDFPGSLGGHSDINTERINAIKFKAIAKIPWTWSTLHPGDCVFIPAGYLHQVRSYGRSVSITVEFSPPDEFDDTGCVLVEEEFVPLSHANYMLAFKDGELRLADPDLNPEKLRSILMTLTGPTNGLTEANFANFYRMVLGEESGVPPASRVFAFMTSEERESRLTQTDLAELSPAALQKVTDIFNSAYGNTQTQKPTEIKRTDADNLHRTAHDEM